MWFKELESYKRIDTMCTLLNMCLPFELRFLGTCLEELGRRDSQELRGIELRVNNPQDLAADMVACQKGEPTDKKIRRKMALYLALIRACNRTCVTEIFRTLKGWEDCDFMNMTDADTLQELLLVYTMAANHPVFSFEQHMKCTEIFEKIKKNKLVAEPQPMTASASAASGLNQYGVDSMSSSGYTASATQAQPQQTLPTPQTQQQQQQPQHMPTQQEMLQLNAYHFATNTAGQHQQIIQMLPQGINFQQAHHVTKLIPTADASLSHQITVDSIPAQMLTSNITIPADSTSAMLTHPNAWMRPYPPPQGPGMEV